MEIKGHVCKALFAMNTILTLWPATSCHRYQLGYTNVRRNWIGSGTVKQSGWNSIDTFQKVLNTRKNVFEIQKRLSYHITWIWFICIRHTNSAQLILFALLFNVNVSSWIQICEKKRNELLPKSCRSHLFWGRLKQMRRDWTDKKKLKKKTATQFKMFRIN